MKRLFMTFIIAMLIFSGCSAKEENIVFTAVEIELLEDDTDPEYRKITPEQAKEMIDGGKVVILDVRTSEEFDEAHIAGAVLLPDYDMEARAFEVLTDKAETILVYCRSGRRSEAAAKTLVHMGYGNVYDFGGIIDWPYDTVIEE